MLRRRLTCQLNRKLLTGARWWSACVVGVTGFPEVNADLQEPAQERDNAQRGLWIVT
jgi:hypothetical protein